MIWNEHDWARVSFSFNQKSISIIYPTELQSWQWNGFWWFSFAIVSDALFMCFVMELLVSVCVFVWECISLVAFAGNQLSFKLTRFCANVSSCVWWVLSGWHAKTWLPYKQYQSFPFGCHFSSATTTTTMKINSHHAIWQLKIQTVCYQCVEYIYAKKSHLLGLSVWW